MRSILNRIMNELDNGLKIYMHNGFCCTVMYDNSIMQH